MSQALFKIIRFHSAGRFSFHRSWNVGKILDGKFGSNDTADPSGSAISCDPHRRFLEYLHESQVGKLKKCIDADERNISPVKFFIYGPAMFIFFTTDSMLSWVKMKVG